MSPKIASILADLYALDPSLKEQETELIPALEALLQAKPDLTLDANFATQLRQQLVTPSFKHKILNFPVFMQKFVLAGLGGLVAIVICVPLTYSLTSQSKQPKFNLGELAGVPSIKQLGANAFENVGTTPHAPPLGDLSTRSSTQALGGGGNQSATSNYTSESDKIADTSLVIGEPYPGNSIEYIYTYTGETLDLSNLPATVYRGTTGLSGISNGGELIRGQFGPFNLSNLNNLSIQSFSAKQSDPMGYSIYVDKASGYVSLGGNEGHWQSDYSPLSESEIMSDQALIQTADKFLAELKINKAGFGQAVVDTQGVQYALRMPAESRYIPDVVTITYPYLLDGQVAKDSSGNAYGLQVSVNMRTKLVSSVWLNVISAFDKSDYELERDAGTILKFATQGGLYAWRNEGATEQINIELGTPELVLVKDFMYSNSGTETFFVPALSFPVTKNSDTQPLYTNQIIIPLVKNLLNEINNPILY